MNNYFVIFFKKNCISIIVSLYIFFYILGPAIINLFTTILSIISLFFIFNKKYFLNIFKDMSNLLIIVFFLFICFTSILNKNLDYDVLSFLRLVLIFLSISFFSQNFKDYQNLDFRFLYLIITLISVDTIFQYFNGTNLLGFEKYDHIRLTGIFDDEPIIGSFLMKMVIPLIWIFFISSKINLKILLAISLTIISITLSAERMPLLQLLFSLFLIFIILLFNKQKKTNSYFFVLLLPLIFLSIIFSDSVKNRIYSTFENTYDLTHNILIKNDIDNSSSVNQYFMNFYSGIYLWKENKIIGGGYRFYNKECTNKFIIGSENYCSTHPHNIYIEILSDYGLLGLLIFILFIINLSIRYFKTIYFYQNLGIYLIFLVTSVPFVTSQSIFSSHYGSIYFLSIFLIKYFIVSKKKLLEI